MKNIVKKLIADEYSVIGTSEFIGPMFNRYLTMNTKTVTSHPTEIGTLYDMYKLFMEPSLMKFWSDYPCKDENLTSWFRQFRLSRMHATGDNGVPLGEYVISKLSDFFLTKSMKNIFCQDKSTINFFDLMNNNKIILVNLSKGILSTTNSNFFGIIILSSIYKATMKRANLKISERKPFFLYVDEFQNIATQNFELLLSEARKYKVGVILANQYISQLKSTNIDRAIFGNISTLASFRLSLEDAEYVSQHFQPFFDANDLINLPNWNGIVLTKVNGQNQKPFTYTTIPDNPVKNPVHKEDIVQLSRCKYSVSVKDIEERLVKKYEDIRNHIEEDDII